MATPLFVSGCPRSGTTALTRLINHHPDIVVGLERYKGVYGKRVETTPELFTPERFFDFRPTDTNFTPDAKADAAAFYANAQEKFADAQFVGDKYPQFFRMYDTLFKQWPEAKVIFIFRDPAFVAQSWQRRADDTSRWPAENDAKKASQYWNDALAYTLAYTQVKRHAFVFVEYETLFGGESKELVELLRRLGARMTPEIEAGIATASEGEFARSRTVLAQEMSLGKDIARNVKNAADMNLHKRARRVFEAQRAG